MSESTLIDWLAIGSWTAAAIFQTSTAIRDGWKSFRGKPNPSSPYQRLLDGESVKGWRRIIPNPADGVGYAADMGCYLVRPKIGDQEPEGGQGGYGFSLDFALISRLLDGRETHHLRRYSRLRSCSTLLLEMIFDRRHYRRQFECYLDSCTVVTMFKQEGTSNFKIIFLNVVTRKVRQLMVDAPNEVDHAEFAYLSTSPKRQLHVIYVMKEVEEDGDLHLHLFDSSYDLPPIDIPSPLIISSSSWESISIPFGNRLGFCIRSIWALVFVVIDTSDAGAAENHLCVSIDTEKKWRIDTMAAWLSSVQNTTMGASVLDAIRGIAPYFSATDFRDVPLFRHRYVLPVLGKTEILMRVDQLGTLQRRLAPFSLKRSAVEIVCKVSPDVKMSAIKEATGVDVSDGIVEGGDVDIRGDCEVIYL